MKRQIQSKYGMLFGGHEAHFTTVFDWFAVQLLIPREVAGWDDITHRFPSLYITMRSLGFDHLNWTDRLFK